jgi:hypothetical protein
LPGEHCGFQQLASRRVILPAAFSWTTVKSGLTSTLTMNQGSFWERWRPAGEFRFSAPDQPTGRRRSQEVLG